uniref:MADS-box domain-containing protein n=1 Tax=Leersia perrieri TaxID=77586 RepID=A0A0D9VCJ3_9ORYZ
MKAIEDKNARQVCAGRDGVYKKASELSALCGAHFAVVFFSPAGNPHSFAHPSLRSVSDRFLSLSAAPETTTRQEEMVVREFNQAEERLTEARRRDALDEVDDGDDVRRAGVVELVSVAAALEGIRVEVAERVREIVAAAAVAEETMLLHLQYGAAAAAMEDDKLLIGGDFVHAPPSLHPHFERDGFGYSGFAGGGYGYDFEVLDGWTMAMAAMAPATASTMKQK